MSKMMTCQDGLLRVRPLMIGGAEEIEKKKFLKAFLQEKINFKGPSPGKNQFQKPFSRKKGPSKEKN